MSTVDTLREYLPRPRPAGPDKSLTPSAPAGRTGGREARSREWWAIGGLLLVTVAWGSTFVLLDQATERIPAADYLAVRFGLAAVVLATLRPRALTRMPRRLVAQAVLIGALFGGGNLLLTIGLSDTTASVSAFVTGMYVVFTPILAAAVLRQRLPGQVWAATGLAMAGLGVMTLRLDGGALLGRGELITLLAALVCAGQIVALGVWSDARYTVELAVIQSATTALICGVFALPGGLTLPSGRSEWLVMTYMAIVVGAVTMLLQTWAQAHLHPARAAIVMTFEPVWAAVFAVLLGGEVLGWRFAAGAAAVLAAMYLCERPPTPEPAHAPQGTPHAPRGTANEAQSAWSGGPCGA
ncbi:MAG: DMT family transporter [Kineosporiaceae bacterium]|nr:DMT family transporter [Kineosporiaceae bacterium]